MRIAICDDDQSFVETLLTSIRKFFRDKQLKRVEYKCFNSGEELIAEEQPFDMAFLDVEMDGISGINAGKKLKEKNSKVIIFIVTSYADYLDDAMEYQVYRYLMKPIDEQRLYRNLKTALKNYTTAVHKVGITTKEGVTTVYASDIIFVEAANRKVIIYVKDQEYISKDTMENWRSELKENCFFQTHKSFIVNMQYVKSFDDSMVSLTNGKNAYLTKRKYREFKDAYLLYLESIK